MKLFVGIVSCERDRFTHQAIRDTWLKNCGIDYKFLMGCPSQADDELDLKCGDTYEELTDKALATIRWVLDHDYDYMLHVGRDTYVNLPRLLAAGLEGKDYAGNCGCSAVDAYYCPLTPIKQPEGPDIPFHYASGGAGSWLSRKAMTMILNSSLRHIADDLMFGWILGTHGIPLWHDIGFQKRSDRLYSARQFSLHLWQSGIPYRPEWMYMAHRLSR